MILGEDLAGRRHVSGRRLPRRLTAAESRLVRIPGLDDVGEDGVHRRPRFAAAFALAEEHFVHGIADIRDGFTGYRRDRPVPVDGMEHRRRHLRGMVQIRVQLAFARHGISLSSKKDAEAVEADIDFHPTASVAPGRWVVEIETVLLRRQLPRLRPVGWPVHRASDIPHGSPRQGRGYDRRRRNPHAACSEAPTAGRHRRLRSWARPERRRPAWACRAGPASGPQPDRQADQQHGGRRQHGAQPQTRLDAGAAVAKFWCIKIFQ